MNSHQAIHNRLVWKQWAFALAPGDRVLQKTPFSFDVSVWEFFWPLREGATLVVAAPGGHRDAGYLVDLIARERVTTLHFVPSMLQVFLEAPFLERASSIRRLIASGEALPAELAERCLERLGVPVDNLYGPTEAAVDVTWWRATEPRGRRSLPIGRPVFNTQVYVLDRRLRPVPIGVTGELYLAGIQLARGYWRRPGLTAERFVPDPLSDGVGSLGPGARMYKTGDLGRLAPDGAIEYLGRTDFQVKLRGLRIELGEIEAALAKIPGVREVVVVARGDRAETQMLVAYLVAEVGISLPPVAEIKRVLAESLPEYMVPSAFVVLDALPLSPNGKVDRKLLPAPEESLPAGERGAVAPRDVLEAALAEMFARELGLDSIGVEDSFFELGGNSIRGAVLINQLQAKLAEIVHVVTIFDAPTVAKLAVYLRREHAAAVARVWGEAALASDVEMGGAAKPAVDPSARVDAGMIAAMRSLVPALPSERARNPRALFVLSPPRSGTTLLRVMLGGHPSLFAPPELELLSFRTMGARAAAFSGPNRFFLEGAIRAVMEARGWDAEQAAAWMAAREAADTPTREVVRELQGWIGGRLLVDKTPTYALDERVLARMEDEYEEALYVHLVRHPLGCVLSFEEAKMDQIFFRREHPFSRRQLAELFWTISHQNTLAFLARVPAERQFLLSYEELVAAPERELARLCAWLGLPYHPDMAKPYERGRQRMTDGLTADSRMLGDVKFHQHRGVDARAADRWREVYQEDFLGDETWRVAAALGYGRFGEDAHAGERPAQGRPLQASAPVAAGPSESERGPAVAAERHPLSFAQERLWILDRIEPGRATYNVPAGFALRGALDARALVRTLVRIVERHAVLRTRYLEENGTPWQEIAPNASLPFAVVDLSRLGNESRARVSQQLARAEARRPFDLSSAPMLRVRLLRLDASAHEVLVTLHHIAADGWSLGVVARELATLYTAFARGAAEPLPPLAWQYADYARAQRSALSGEALAQETAWWRERLAGAPPLELPTDRPRPAVATARGGVVRFQLPRTLRTALERAAHRAGASPFMALLATYAATLARHAAGRDFAVGIPVAGRNRPELEGLIGFFVNTLALRFDLTARPGLGSLIAHTRESAVEAFRHQELPFEKLVEELAPRRDPSRTSIFQTMFSLQNARAEGFALPGLAVEPLEVGSGTAKFELTLLLGETPEGYAGVIEHNLDLFDRATAARFAAHFERLLAEGLAAPERPFDELPLLSPAERWALLGEWNDTGRDHDRTRAIPRRILEHASARPDGIALIDAAEQVSYGELVRRASDLARRLEALGVGRESVVAVLAERSVALVVSQVAAWLAGGAYLPLDPALPAERLRYMIEDSGCAVVVSAAPSALDLPELVVPVCHPERSEGPGGAVRRHPPRSLAALGMTNGDALAYVIYTSGSTGLPKGTELTHGGLANLVDWHLEAYALTGADTTSLVAGVGFDATVWETWPTLAAGGRLAIASKQDVLDPARLARFMAESALAVSFLPTPVAEAVLVSGEVMPATLRHLLTGGDRLRRRASDPRLRLVNHYGPTEVTVVTTAGGVDAAGTSPPPIGRPLPNLDIYVLDRRFELQPFGVPGELVIGGESLGRGYRRRAALTAERFVPHPFSALPGARLYRTGDLVRLLASGEVDFLGRIDAQVKVRGQRIELGEIEAVLSAQPEVREAVVIARDDGAGGARLVAYVVWRGADDPARVATLRHHLAERLPEVMVPRAFVVLEELPLTPNGKVDRRALPEPELERGGRAPESPLELLVARTFGEVLGRDEVFADDDFFALGGHSLIAARVAARLSEALGAEVPLRRLFDTPTVEALARSLATLEAAGTAPPLVRAARPETLPLSFAQHRLWFIDRLEPGNPVYNIPAALALAGELNTLALSRALDEIARRHESLRTVFRLVGEEPEQVVLPPARVALPAIDLSGLDAASEGVALDLARRSARRRFDLARGPLLRAELLRLTPRRHVLSLALHHVVADGGSVSVLRKELAVLYGAFREGLPSPLAELPVQVPDYALWQRGWLRDAELDRQLEFWRARLTDVPVLELPADRPRPAVQTFRGGAERGVLSRGLVERLEAFGRARGATLFMVLLAGYEALLARLAGQVDFAVGTPVSGRGRRETETMIGLFVNTLALRADLSGGPSFATLLERVRESTLAAFTHQEVPFERLVEALVPDRSLGRTPLFQTIFTLQTLAVERLALPGLELEALEIAPAGAKFELGLAAAPIEGGRVGLMMDFNADLYDGTRIRRWLAHYVRLLEASMAAPEEPLAELPLLSPAERHQLLCEWSGGGAPRPGATRLEELFFTVADERPDAAALLYRDQVTSYGVLARAVRALAARLRQEDAVGQPVGILIEPSSERFVALLGTFAAGAIAVPLDPALPPSRLAAMLEDCAAEIVLVGPGQEERLSGLGLGLSLRALAVGASARLSKVAPARSEAVLEVKLPEPDANDAAYVIYTSGSTGVPNGVVVPHGAAANLLRHAIADFGLGPGARSSHLVSFGFDASILETFLALGSGASLWIAGPGEKPGDENYSRAFRERAVTHAVLTPVMLGALEGEFPHLELVPVGGDRLPIELAARWSERLRLVNCYGPTEAAIYATSGRVRTMQRRDPSIGSPVSGVETFIVDRSLRPVPLGVAGELVLGGVGLAHGYLRRPRLTAERFVPRPFVCTENVHGARLYRTGDLVRALPDGRLEFLGRVDAQVKLRGLRIELGEIEAALARLPGIAEAAVVMAGAGAASRLVAFVERRGDGELPALPQLREALSQSLPAYMVPSAIVEVSALPQTATGKVDRRQLLQRVLRLEVSPREARAAANELEAKLLEIWRDLLASPTLGVEDDFFSHGGHSLLAVRMAARVRRELGLELPLQALFHAPTVERLAAFLAQEAPAEQGSPLVLLREGQDGPPLFLVHPVGGSVFCYRDLAARLPEGRAVYGLQARGLSRGEEPRAAIEPMAAAYVDAIRTVQPHGPYELAGWSFGGYVALEMAAQLEAVGERVSRVVLIDTAALSKARRGPALDEVRILSLAARDLGGLSRQQAVPFDWRDVAHVPESERLAAVLARARAASILPPEADTSEVLRLLAIYRAHVGAVQIFAAPTIAAPILLLQAEEGTAASGRRGWTRLTSGKVERFRVPGTHYSILSPPLVEEIARLLARRDPAKL